MADNKIGTIRLDVLHIPELIFQLRHELAELLRSEADADADPRIARRLRELAAAFEVGRADGRV